MGNEKNGNFSFFVFRFFVARGLWFFFGGLVGGAGRCCLLFVVPFILWC